MKRLKTCTMVIVLTAVSAFASLTTVTQSVVGPDGNPANGQALIRISAACTSGSNYVGERTIQVKFTAGAFSVSLVPTDTCPVSGGASAAWSSVTAYNIGDRVIYRGGVYVATSGNTNVAPGAGVRWSIVSPVYTVAWILTGGTSWTDTWMVPTSVSPVTVDSVKVAQSSAAVLPIIGPMGPQGPTGPQGAKGDKGDKGDTGDAGAYSVAYVDGETPAGTIDGANAEFTLVSTPNPAASLLLLRNGMGQKAGGFDYSLSGNAITFVLEATPQPGDTLLAWYRIGGSVPGVNFADQEAVVGTIDGTNVSFTLEHAPNPVGSLLLLRNGMGKRRVDSITPCPETLSRLCRKRLRSLATRCWPGTATKEHIGGLCSSQCRSPP